MQQGRRESVREGLAVTVWDRPGIGCEHACTDIRTCAASHAHCAGPWPALSPVAAACDLTAPHPKPYALVVLLVQEVFEIGRRYKIQNPEKMRSEYGKLMYMLMDSSDTHIQVTGVDTGHRLRIKRTEPLDVWAGGGG